MPILAILSLSRCLQSSWMRGFHTHTDRQTTNGYCDLQTEAVQKANLVKNMCGITVGIKPIQCNSISMHSRLVCQNRSFRFEENAYYPGPTEQSYHLNKLCGFKILYYFYTCLHYLLMLGLAVP